MLLSTIRKVLEVPEQYFNPASTHPMDGNVYVNEKLHQAYHHYIKVCFDVICFY